MSLMQIFGEMNSKVESGKKLNKVLLMYLSQMATYWFVIGWFDIQKAQKSKV